MEKLLILHKVVLCHAYHSGPEPHWPPNHSGPKLRNSQFEPNGSNWKFLAHTLFHNVRDKHHTGQIFTGNKKYIINNCDI